MASAPSSEPRPGHLYLVGTPIGNLEDISFRALRILREVDLIAAEDTRHTGRLLQHFQIETPQLSYHNHSRHSRLEQLLTCLDQGQAVALVSDAGMPGISDPGADLVATCWQRQIPVVPIPGPTAAISALVASGLSPDRFVFEGFLPTKGSARQQAIQRLQQESRSVVLYEAPHRLAKTLTDLAQTLDPQRPVVLAREITKRFEEFWQGTLTTAVAHCQAKPPKGEYTLVVGGCAVGAAVPSPAIIRQELQALLAQGKSRSAASRQLANSLGYSKNLIYQIALTLEVPPEPKPPNE